MTTDETTEFVRVIKCHHVQSGKLNCI